MFKPMNLLQIVAPKNLLALMLLWGGTTGCGFAPNENAAMEKANTECLFNDAILRVGEVIPTEDGCNNCACLESGDLFCTTLDCSSENHDAQEPAPEEEGDGGWVFKTRSSCMEPWNERSNSALKNALPFDRKIY